MTVLVVGRSTNNIPFLFGPSSTAIPNQKIGKIGFIYRLKNGNLMAGIFQNTSF